MPDRRAGFDRVHQKQLCVRSQRLHQFDFAAGCHIKMANACGPQRHDDGWVRVCLHGIEDLAGKPVEEFMGSGGDLLRVQHEDCVIALIGLNDLLNARKGRQA